MAYSRRLEAVFTTVMMFALIGAMLLVLIGLTTPAKTIEGIDMHPDGDDEHNSGLIKTFVHPLQNCTSTSRLKNTRYGLHQFRDQA